jgi:hypothetical protein
MEQIKTQWKNDPNGYAREYYKENSKIFIPCVCGCAIKKVMLIQHLKTKKHKYKMLELENKNLKSNPFFEQVENLRDSL